MTAATRIRTIGHDPVTRGVFVVTDVPADASPVQATRAVAAHRDAVRLGIAVAIGDRPAPSPFAHHFGGHDPRDAQRADIARIDDRLAHLRSGYMSPGLSDVRMGPALLAEWFAEVQALIARRNQTRRAMRSASRAASRASSRRARAAKHAPADPVAQRAAETARLREIARAASDDGHGPVDSWQGVARRPKRRAA